MPKLRWSSTGDEIDLIPHNRDLYHYFVETINTKQINQYMPEKQLDLEKVFFELSTAINSVKKILSTVFKINFVEVPQNYLDQNDLNSLHTEWVKLSLKYPRLKHILESIDPDSVVKFDRINKLIHALEESFDEFRFNTKEPDFNFENKFGPEILTFGVVNIAIAFNNLGRSTYNKWLNFDDNTDDIDTNDYKEIYTQLAVTFRRPNSFLAPIEYKHWAEIRKTQPFGKTLALANFDNLQTNLLKYRQMFYKNLQIENNYFTLEE